jgi:hypothetical protein
VRCITKENTIDRPSLELIQLLSFLKDKAFATKDMKVTHLGCAPVTYQNFECFTMCEFSQKFKTFCLNLCAIKFDPNMLASHPKFSIK